MEGGKLMIVFNDSYKSEGFEIGIEEANKILIDLGLHLEYKFIEDYVSDNGEYAYTLTVEKRNLLLTPNSRETKGAC